MKSLIGRKVIITDKDSMYYGEWGTIIGFDDAYYYVAIADGMDSVPIFKRDEFRVRRGI